jgi:hypothetical protein
MEVEVSVLSYNSFKDQLAQIRQALIHLEDDMHQAIDGEDLEKLDGDDPISNATAALVCIEDALDRLNHFFKVK